MLAVQFFFGTRKQGFHEDEFYSFFSTNRSVGLFAPDREWADTTQIRDEFVVLEGEGFNYGLVKRVQTWDVHPPLYYQILHTVCSLFPGIFSKWLGIAVNLIAFASSLILAERIAERFSLPFSVRMLYLALIGCNAAIISVNMFLRMYAWLTFWVLLAVYLHTGLWHDAGTGAQAGDAPQETRRVSFVYPAIAFCNFCGFLTHYYYLIFIAFLAFLTMMTFSREARKRVPAFIAAHAAGFMAAVAVYPSAAAHILRGYRGKEATAAFLSAENLGERLLLFARITWNVFLADGTIFLAGVALAAFIVISRQWHQKGVPDRAEQAGLRFSRGDASEAEERLYADTIRLAIPCAAYFLVVSKTALLLGETSIRYLAPIYPLLLLLILLFVRLLLPEKGMAQAIAVLMVAVTLIGLTKDRVLFLYPENRERIAFDDAHTDAAVIVAYNELTPDRIWWITDHLLRFDKVFFLAEQNEEAVTDAAITSSSELLVFAADEERQAQVLEELATIIADHATSGRAVTDTVWMRDMWTLYHIQAQ